MPADNNAESLGLLYTESGRRAAALSDRQFSVTLQLLGLHGAVFAATVIHEESLTSCTKLLGSIAVVILDVLAVAYLWQKAASYWQANDLNAEVEAKLRLAAGVANDTQDRRGRKAKGVAFRGFRGTAYFMAVIVMSGGVTVIAIYAA